jgi:hypothetical protein
MSTETGHRDTGARECTFCHHSYIKPCDGKNASCLNLLHLTTTPTATTKPKVERVKLNPQPKPKKKKAKRK